MKKRRNLLALGMITALLLTGCQSGSSDAENKALKEQITQLEQKVTELEQQGTAVTTEQDHSANESAANNSGSDTSAVQTTENAGTTTTMEELTSRVNAFVEKADAAVPGSDEAKNMEQFFSLKQEEHQIDKDLDLHEDELESQYRNGTLTREEYKKLERELEQLEDQLDNAEDRLERVFGIDD